MYRGPFREVSENIVPQASSDQHPKYMNIKELNDVSMVFPGEQLKGLSNILPDIVGFCKRLSEEPEPITNPANIIKNLGALKPAKNDKVNVFMNVKIFIHTNNKKKQPEEVEKSTKLPEAVGNYIETPIYVEQPKPPLIENDLKPSTDKTMLQSLHDTKIFIPQLDHSIESKNNFRATINNDVLLKKRDHISKKCNCAKNNAYEDQFIFDAFYDQQLLKIKFFWRGTNLNYPFTFKKKVMRYYVDTEELSVNEIIDYSKKLIQADEMNF